MKHHADQEFWTLFHRLPEPTQSLSRKNFELLKSNPRHTSLHFTRIGSCWSVRVGLSHRAVAEKIEGGFLWFWIGSRADYDKMV